MTTLVKNAPKKAVKKVNTRKLAVNASNNNMKQVFRSTGKALKFIASFYSDECTPEFKERVKLGTIKAIIKDDAMYKSFDAFLRTDAKGNAYKGSIHLYRVLSKLYTAANNEKSKK